MNELSQHDLNRLSLESLVVDNPDLERLEASLDQFNVFEALGVVRQELRHSSFLAFLLDPQENHDLGDEFAKRLLQKVLSTANSHSIPLTPIDLDVWDLNHLVVQREWQNIDILLIEKHHRLVVIIENKIDSVEHSNQLERYFLMVSQHYPGWNVLGIYLTPEGETSSHAGYVAISYTTISQIVERMVGSRSSNLDTDVRSLMIHYTQMLRRHIVSESEIAELCRRIYRKHQRALDLIYEHRPDQQAAVRELIEGLVRETPSLVLDHCSKSYIRFAAQEWDVPTLLSGEGWTESGRILLFEFMNSPNRLKLGLHIGPGPDHIRQKLFDMAQKHPPLFRTQSKSLNRQFNVIYGKSFLIPKDYEDSNIEQLTKELRKHWSEFEGNDLPRMLAAVGDESWIRQEI
jgi:hypothetical protein